MPSPPAAPSGSGPGQRFAERCLHAALLAIPAYFTVFSERVFEAEKAGLLRWLAACALLGLAFGLGSSAPSAGATAGRSRVRASKTGPGPSLPSPSLRRPIPLAMHGLLAATLLSALTSVAPATSFMGAYLRGQGLLTLLAFALFAFVAARVAISKGGLRRLSVIIALSGFAPALYGLLQSFGLDPLPWEGDVVTRVVGSAGNSVMLAAHLVLCLPFAFREAWRAWGASGARGLLGGSAALAGWSLVLGVEALAVALSGSRGPILGLAAGLFVLVLARAAIDARRRAALGTASAALVALLLLLLLNFPPAPVAPLVAPLREVPLLDRFSTALDPERNTTRVRLRLWEGSAAALEAHPERRLLGFGPETMDRIWAPFYPPILAYDEPRGYLPDRAHNLVLDGLLTGGLLGLTALLGLFGAAIVALLRVLGLGARSLTFVPAAGILAALALRSMDGSWRLSGLALGLGCLAGLSLVLLRIAFRSRPRAEVRRPSGRWTERRAFAAAALAAVTAHFVELQVGFQLVASGLVFWVLAGAAWGLGSLGSAESEAEQPDEARLPHDLAALAATVVGATLLFSLARPGLVAGGVGAVLFLVTASAAMAGLLVFDAGVAALDADAGGTSGSGAMRVGRFRRAALWPSAYALIHLGLLVRLRDRPEDALPVAAFDLLAYGLFVPLLCAWSARRDRPDGSRRRDVEPIPVAPSSAAPITEADSRLRRWAALGSVTCLLAGLFLFAAPTLADVAYKDGLRAWQSEVGALRGEGESGMAESFLSRASRRYAQASRIAPWVPEYRLAAARAQVEWADLLDARLSRRLAAAGLAEAADEYESALLDGAARSVALERDARFEAALAHLDRAEAGMAASPLPVLTRARSLRVWGDRTREADRRGRRLRAAAEAYREAMALAPGWPEVIDEAALTASLADDPMRAIALARDAVELDPFFRRAWRTAAESHMAVGDASAAVLAYREYFVDYRNRSDVPALRGWMEALAADGQWDEALLRAREIQRLRPADAGALADLAQLLHATGDEEAALEAAEAAGELAPEDQAIRRLIRDLAGSNEKGGAEF